ncbi:MAG: semialdehyde dehydrogenase [Puniceicoccaceae bacterium]|nr:MAG: semialdehyde dehydrogenase [Puniceicoccaceae bacterium]
MKTTLALLGAGGKMGCRLTDNLKDNPDFRVHYIEISPAGLENLAARGVSATPREEALAEADAVILALPDKLIGGITAEIVPALRPGAMVIGLDPAAAYAEVMPIRDDLTYFVTHPCHPPLFADDHPADETTDWFGGKSQPQSVVCALHHGPEEDYAKGEAIARALFAPILRMHRVTVEQMAILEPAVVESTGIGCIMVWKQALDRAIEMGVPKEAAWDFVMGHIRIELAIVFGFAGFPFSDGAKKAVEQNMTKIFRDDWMQVLELPSIRESVRDITGAASKGN